MRRRVPTPASSGSSGVGDGEHRALKRLRARIGRSTLYLARYSEKRWLFQQLLCSLVLTDGSDIRYMLLSATYCTPLRAPLSLLFLVTVCVVYYNKKAKLEEGLMPVVADAASSRFTSEVVSLVFASPSENKGFFSNGNLDDAASAYTWLLVR
ncbi:hypothetical protein HID58_004848 [Brassica napus]|uniref:Uncharacterized protein n=1 Tax=Brassica napus TaxID=3708 RepID=A0ABQ8E7M0_BRANA|nr:hypothetical protein HID58_004848 [Brassica napus]